MDRFDGMKLLVALLIIGAVAAEAGPGDGIRVVGDALTVSPFAGVGVTHDSNVLTGTNEIDDVFYELTAGIDMNGNATWGTASLRAWFQDRTYNDTGTRDSENFSEVFAATVGDPDSVEVKLSQRYSSTTDYTFDERDVGLTPMDRKAYDLPLLEGVALAAKKDQQSYAADVRHAFTKLDLTAGAEYAAVNYESDLIGDWSEVAGNVSAEYTLTPKTSAAFDIKGSQQDSDVLMDDATFASARVGVRYAATTKIDVRATIGYMDSDAGETDTGTELEESGIDYEVIGSWQASRKVAAQVSASSAIIPSEIYTQNIKRLDELSAALLFDLTDRFDASISAQARRDAYAAAIDGETDPSQDTIGGIASLIYQAPGDFLMIALRVRHDMFESNFEDDFDVTRVGLSANIRY